LLSVSNRTNPKQPTKQTKKQPKTQHAPTPTTATKQHSAMNTSETKRLHPLPNTPRNASQQPNTTRNTTKQAVPKQPSTSTQNKNKNKNPKNKPIATRQKSNQTNQRLA
jgi:hypothetical protein